MKTSPKPAPQEVSSDHNQYSNGQSNQPLAANPSPQPTSQSSKSMKPRRQMRGLSLKNKATALVIALGTLPVLAIGATAYYFADQAIVKQIKQQKDDVTAETADKVSRFMFERHGDIQAIANLPIVRNPKVRAVTTPQEKQVVLDRYAEIYGVYDSIAVADLAGNTILQSSGDPVTGLGERDYFKEVIRTKRPVITPPRKSALNGKYSIFLAAPVVDSATGKMSGVVRSRMPMESLEKVVANVAGSSGELHLIDSSGKFFLVTGKGKDLVGKDAKADFPDLPQLQAQNKAGTQTMTDFKNNQSLVSYAPFEKLAGLPDLNWQVLLTNDLAETFAPQRQLLWTLLVGTALTALIVSAIAAYLADRATRPILAASKAVEKMGQGELDTRIAVKGEDEIAVLGSNVNRLGGQIQTLLADQEEATRQQLATQAENVRQQSANAEQQRLGKELLQKRALELLIEVDPVSQGDLTIRANVTEDEIGTVADSYNATIASLRKIVTQVQVAATQMATTTSNSEVSVQELSAEALRQTQEITAALNQLQEMSDSIRAVATSAAQAEAAVQLSTQTVEAGDAAMNRTVEGIGAIRDTVAETSTKVKQLGESSQKISKVVKLIGTFAAQTNLLALKASIEAARAGEEGRGFAVLADEVRVLARQSAAATAEIEGLVTGIQTETNDVVAAMAAGTAQVAEGTRLVDETRQSLNQITAVSTQISTLVQAIASATVTQSQASESVTHTMTDVAAIANQTSTEANHVSASFKELLAVAQELQASANQFKVS